MLRNIFDVIKSLVVLLLIIGLILALPFFLTAIMSLLAFYMIFVIIKAIRIYREEEKANAKAKADAAKASAGY